MSRFGGKNEDDKALTSLYDSVKAPFGSLKLYWNTFDSHLHHVFNPRLFRLMEPLLKWFFPAVT